VKPGDLELIKRKFPVSADTAKRNAAGSGGLHAVNQKPVERMSLDGASSGEEARWYGSARKFEISFTVFACQPCDWDGWDIKRLQDWCVKAGLLPDDGWATLSGGVKSEKVHTEAEERTEIIIRAL
jgi:hypothetical protein